ncbi:P-loop NTPase family protein [Candidatus Methylacidithermus pantelleriae]|uniref:CobQ/CobB/MinD/ParA nucleotide binding domain-containing protein n=1 Tax=Candidatus Methylacidithermus pantelleriae TaxID=2744239 RepID=A0A8J2FV19_9BACT|nr:hypothetical protein [Candidatus Methylacidithermus pantelleriae]CAF0689661.1 conserved hypothetical protein [Candidatus Methylacidithermus pantelleriae]
MTTHKTEGKRLILVHGEKGGVGKSTFARTLAEFYTEHFIPWHGYDCDANRGPLFRCYKDRVSTVSLYQVQSIDSILSGLTKPYDRLIVDLGARSGELVQRWMDDVDLLALQDELPFTLTVALVIGPLQDSIDIVCQTLESLKDKAKYVVVKNQYFGQDAFGLYDRSRAPSLLKRYRSVEISLPALASPAFLQVDAENLAWRAATMDDRLDLGTRQRVKTFLRSAFEQLEKAADFL